MEENGSPVIFDLTLQWDPSGKPSPPSFGLNIETHDANESFDVGTSVGYKYMVWSRILGSLPWVG